MKSKYVRYLLLGLMCGGFAAAGYWAGMVSPKAEASIEGTLALPAITQSQGAVGNGAYTVLPILDGGSGYTWMAYAIAISPKGKVSILKTHPKEEAEIGTILKQFSIE
ncbi:MAG: hypothetical protein AMXMBFR84_13300 [Candidatus Hydrogenedentota bacterium]